MTIQEKQRLIEHYTRDRYPVLLGISGPWEIRQSATGAQCAAIPVDPASGHLPSAYGTVRDVRANIRAGLIQPATKAPMQSTIHNPQITEEILSAVQAANLGNNGHADVPRLSLDTIHALQAAGYSVAESSKIYPNGYTVAKPGVPLPGAYFPPSPVIDCVVQNYGFDFEAGILAKQSLAHLY